MGKTQTQRQINIQAGHFQRRERGIAPASFTLDMVNEIAYPVQQALVFPDRAAALPDGDQQGGDDRCGAATF